MTIKIDLNNKQETYEDDEMPQNTVEAELILIPEEKDGINFRFQVNEEGTVNVQSIRTVKNKDNLDHFVRFKQRSKYDGFQLEHSNQNFQLILNRYLAEKYIDTELAQLIHQTYENEFVIELKESIIHINKYLEREKK